MTKNTDKKTTSTTRHKKPSIGDVYVNKIRKKINSIEREILTTEEFLFKEDQKRKLIYEKNLGLQEALPSLKTTDQGKDALAASYNKLADLKRMEASGLDQHAEWLKTIATTEIKRH